MAHFQIIYCKVFSYSVMNFITSHSQKLVSFLQDVPK